MKSTTKPTHVGQGVYLERPKKVLHSNEGKKYFTWTVADRILLLIECRDKEAWGVSYGNTQKVFQDICTILKSYPNMEEHFESLTWRKCQEEFLRNMASYKADRAAVPFKSGTSEDHTKWQQIMEEIFELTGMKTSTKLWFNNTKKN